MFVMFIGTLSLTAVLSVACTIVQTLYPAAVMEAAINPVTMPAKVTRAVGFAHLLVMGVMLVTGLWAFCSTAGLFGVVTFLIYSGAVLGPTIVFAWAMYYYFAPGMAQQVID